jgi:hypothetical protein
LAISLWHYTLETLVVYIIHDSETFVWQCTVRTFVRDATITLPFFSLDKRLEHDLPTVWPWSIITSTNQSTTTLSLSLACQSSFWSLLWINRRAIITKLRLSFITSIIKLLSHTLTSCTTRHQHPWLVVSFRGVRSLEVVTQARPSLHLVMGSKYFLAAAWPTSYR